MVSNDIKPDEYELLVFFVDHEISNYKKQLSWYIKNEPENGAIGDIPDYISRLKLLRTKLDAVYTEGEEK